MERLFFDNCPRRYLPLLEATVKDLKLGETKRIPQSGLDIECLEWVGKPFLREKFLDWVLKVNYTRAMDENPVEIQTLLRPEYMQEDFKEIIRMLRTACGNPAVMHPDFKTYDPKEFE